MTETHDAEHGSSSSSGGYLRLPAPLVALALVVVLGGLLGIGLFANANLRPQGVFVPTAAASLPPAVGATAVATAAAAPTATAAARPTETAVATQVATPTALVVATAERTPLVVAVGGTATPPATDVATPLATVESKLAADVGEAYENFWRVRSHAQLTLDTSHVADVMDGSYLQHFFDVTNQLRQENRAIKTQVVLNYTVVAASERLAYVHDRIEDSSFYVELGTETPTSDPEPEIVFIEFTLTNIDGVWKVVDSVRQN